jgi:dTDP-4-amino-4,6-dideoxygalactose transaminase
MRLCRYSDKNNISATEKFEQEFINYLNPPCGHFALLFNSIGSAYRLLFNYFNLPTNSEVIISSYSYASIGIAILQNNLKPQWINPTSDLQYDISKIENLITKNTKVVILTYHDGITVDHQPFYNLAQKYNLIVIEDLSQSIDVEINYQKAGTFYSYSIFSLPNINHINSMEPGAVLVVDDDNKYFEIFYQHDPLSVFHTVHDKYNYHALQHTTFNMSNNLLADFALQQLLDYKGYIQQLFVIKNKLLNQLYLHDFSLDNIVKGFNNPGDSPLFIHLSHKTKEKLIKIKKILLILNIYSEILYKQSFSFPWQWSNLISDHAQNQLQNIKDEFLKYNILKIKISTSWTQDTIDKIVQLIVSNY